MMRLSWFHALSIRRKQVVIIMLTAGVALLLACGAFIALETVKFRDELAERLSTLADVLGNNCTAAIEFGNPGDARETLASFQAEPNIIAALVYTDQGQLFAAYRRFDSSHAFVPLPLTEERVRFEGGLLHVFRPIQQKGERVGTIYVVSDLRELSQRVALYLVVGTLVFLGSLAAAFGLSTRLQHLIADPILQLSGVARKIAQDKNYGLRAAKAGQDEVGQLVDRFNEMLAEIQQRDAALQAARDELERRVVERTAELARSVSLLNATLESTADGVLVVDGEGRVTNFNNKFVEMWHLSRDVMESKDGNRLLETVRDQLKDAEAFFAKVRGLQAQPEMEDSGTLDFKDGRVFERYSQAQWLGDVCVGRVWCFRDVTERKRAEAELEHLHRELMEASRQAGRAEVATHVLHNVGNVLNSVNTSAGVIVHELRDSHISGVERLAALLEEHRHDLLTFLQQGGRAEHVISYLRSLAHELASEQATVNAEVQELQRNVEHIKEIVAVQQSYARIGGVVEMLPLVDVVEDALRLQVQALTSRGVRIKRQYEGLPLMALDRHKILQILINLITNARHALLSAGCPDPCLTLRLERHGQDRVLVAVADNGVGISPENLTRIFAHGFTTRAGGHGFGLHSGWLAAREMGGDLSVHSDGVGCGATFTLELPLHLPSPVGVMSSSTLPLQQPDPPGK